MNNRWSLYHAGDPVVIFSNPELYELIKLLGIDLTNEGCRVTTSDVRAWKLKKFIELLSIEPFNDRGFITKKRQKELKVMANRNVGRPIVGTLKSLTDSPKLMSWLKKYDDCFVAHKKEVFIKRLFQVLQGSRKLFIEVLNVLFMLPDVQEFCDSLFNHKILDVAKINDSEVPISLQPFFDIHDNVNGKGEILASFMFKDVTWLPGNGIHDLKGEEGIGMWHVKHLKSTVRMGNSGYARSRLCTILSDMFNFGLLQRPGMSHPNCDISNEFIVANQQCLDIKFDYAGGFQNILNAQFLESEFAAEGIVFFKGRSHVVVRFMKDTKCVGATKGDFIVKPMNL